MIADYTGLPRQGKTMNAVHDIVDMLRQGRRVVTNTPIFCYVGKKKIEAEFYEDAEKFMFYMLSASSAAVFIDEASLYFSSIRWNKISLDFFGKFRQAGKQSCDLLMTSQSYIDVAASLRRMVDTFHICVKTRWLIPWPLSLQWKVIDKVTGYEVRKGPIIGMPEIYKMITVKKEYFGSQALLEENKEKYVISRRILYPSQSRRAKRCYDHEYQITSSAVGDLKAFGQYKTYEEFKAAGGFK